MRLLNEEGLTEQEYLLKYDPDKYKKPAVTVDMLIFSVEDEKKEGKNSLAQRKLKLLLIRRRNHPCIDRWALPGGFVEIDEGLDEAAKRELYEETGIDADRSGIYLDQLHTWGNVNRDPRTRVISVSYIALIDSNEVRVSAGDDAKDARWFEVQSSILSEKRTASGSGRGVLDSIIELKLKNGDEEYRPHIRIVRDAKEGSKKVERYIEDPGGIAFDHSMIIEYGLERLGE